jgi:Transposase DDE domain group 1
VNIIFRRWLDKCKGRIKRRLDKTKDTMTFEPQFSARNIHYEVCERYGGISCGGIGAIHLLARRIGLIDAIDQRLHLLKFHLPYQESDHVLNFAYNALCNGTCLQDMELRRQDENYLNALGTPRIPDPTTAGDFCRRFSREHLDTLIDIFNDVRLKVWAEQPDDFFNCAKIDMDGTITETTGECKQGMDISYDSRWGYHPFVLTMANTGEVLSLVNRSGNRPSHEGAAAEADRAVRLCIKAGFRKIVLRGDTDFSQTRHLDGWDDDPRIRFFFGYDRVPNLVEIADNLPKSAW